KLEVKVRDLLRSEQKLAIRKLAASGKIGLPPQLKDYIPPFEALLNGTAASPAAVLTPAPANSATPFNAATPVKPAVPVAAPGFEDIFLHDAIGGILLIEQEGPEKLRLTAAQRKKLAVLWPTIRPRLNANLW